MANSPSETRFLPKIIFVENTEVLKNQKLFGIAKNYQIMFWCYYLNNFGNSFESIRTFYVLSPEKH